VLLYELLTGTTPFDRERLKTVSFDEIATSSVKWTNGIASYSDPRSGRGPLM